MSSAELACGACGHSNRAGARFCSGCGARVAVVCPGCRAELEPGDRFCSQCGLALADSAGPPLPAAPAAAPAGSGSGFAGGRYRIGRFLGEGAKKRVYLARDTRLGRDVALAMIKTEGLDAAGRIRVQREAEAMGRLGDHAHIVTIFDVAEENGQLYIVSQFMPGGDVEGLIAAAEGHRLPIADAVRIASHVARALEHAHGRGVIHRDVKPGNVWLAEDGTAKLGDFGLALATERSRLTAEGMMVGTAAYMPPEQAMGQEPDGRSDLYALGVMLYEMVAGRPPFVGNDAVSVLSQHVNTPPVAPSWHNPAVSPELESLILRTLEKLPERRPASASEVRRALEGIEAGPGAPSPRSGSTGSRERALAQLGGSAFVGRQQELAQLRAAADDAISGRGRIVLVVGELGIGKSRTADELATYARLRGAQVLVGRCYEGEGAPAYWPWVQIVRAWVQQREPAELLSDLGAGAPDVAQVVSEVRARLPNLGSAPPLEPDQARFRFFDSTSAFLRNASQRMPLVLVLDDLHWADQPSLLLLRFLAREMAQSRILVVATYRDSELSPSHPLEEVLAALRRERLAERIVLHGLSIDEVRALVATLGGTEVPEPFVAALARETDGNPFFIEEVLRHLIEERVLYRKDGRWASDVAPERMPIPPGVRDVVGLRLARLAPACRAALATASAAGRQFDLPLLERITEVGHRELHRLLEDAVAARVVREVPGRPGRYEFAHALVRDALYGELETPRRAALHRRIGEAIEDLHRSDVEPHLAELAHHFAEAGEDGEPDRAVDYAIRAGAHALAHMAFEEAATHTRRAIDALERRPGADPRRRAELRLALGRAESASGRLAPAREATLAAAELARNAEAPEILAEAALALGNAPFVFELGVFDDAQVRLLEDALARVPAAQAALRARLLARLCVALYWSNQAERCVRLGDEAVAAARESGDRVALAYADYARFMSLFRPGTVEGRTQRADACVALAEAAGDRDVLLFARLMRIAELLEAGDLQRVREDVRSIERLAEEIRHPHALWWASALRAMQALLHGPLAEAEPLVMKTLALGQRYPNANVFQTFGGQMMLLRWDQGRLAELDGAIHDFATRYPEVSIWRVALCFLAGQLGRTQEAKKAVTSLMGGGIAGVEQDFHWPLSLGLLAETCLALDDRAGAAELYERLRPHAARHFSIGFAIGCWGPVARSLGLLASLLGRHGEAAQHFAVAVREAERVGAPGWAARARCDHAEALLARGGPAERARALELANEALRGAQATGASGLVERAVAAKLAAQGVASTETNRSIYAVASAVHREQPDLRRHAAPDGTVTILFSDIENSTALTESLGDRRWLEVLREHNALIREQVALHEGYEVKCQGDGFMVAFASARRALQCAVAIERAFASDGAVGVPLRVRIGLHTGEALREADDFFGKNVILAARIADQARGGEILVSALLKELVDSSGELIFGEPREVPLKGLSGRHRIYPVQWLRA